MNWAQWAGLAIVSPRCVAQYISIDTESINIHISVKIIKMMIILWWKNDDSVVDDEADDDDVVALVVNSGSKKFQNS